MNLAPRHHDILRSAAVSDQMMEAVCESGEDGLIFHFTGVTGRRADQVRLDRASPERRYVGAAGVSSVMPVPPGMEPLVADPTVPLLIVEGSKGVLAAASALLGTRPRIAVVGVLGCWGWSSEGLPTDDCLAIPAKGRTITVLFDADVSKNPRVWDAASRLRDTFMMVGGASSVKFAALPAGGKSSIDDLLGSMSVDERSDVLHRLVGSAGDLDKRPRTRRTPSVYGTDGYSADRTAKILMGREHLALAKDHSIAVYKDGVYHNGESRVFNWVAQDIMRDEFTRMRFLDVEHATANLLAMENKRIPTFQAERKVSFLNGLLDLDTMVLGAHDPQFMTLRQMQVEWDPEATCPLYEQWLRDQCVLPEHLEEIVGQIFDQTLQPRKGALLYGPSRSGKGTFFRLVEAVVGFAHVSAVSLHQLGGNRFASADLYGKSVNLYPDLSSKEVHDLSVIKNIMGGDTVRAERKGTNSFEFQNTAVMLFAANQIPQVSEASQAYYQRITPIPFPHTYASAEDRRVQEALLHELPGIVLRWVRAYLKYLERGEWLPVPGGVRKEFEVESDQVALFVEECCDVGPGNWSRLRDLYMAYRNWTGSQFPLAQRNFMRRLKNVEGVMFPTENERRSKGYNLSLRDRDAWGDDDPGASTSANERFSLAPHSAFKQVSTSEIDLIKVSSNSLSRSEGELKGGFPTGNGGNIGVTPETLHSGSIPTPNSLPTPVIAIDTETGGGPTPKARLLSWAFNGQEAPLKASSAPIGPNPTQGSVRDVLGRSSELLVGHNLLAYDVPALRRVGVSVPIDHCVDTLTLSRLVWPTVRPGAPSHSLGAVAARLGLAGKSADLRDLAKEHGGYDKIPLDDPTYIEYAERDAALHHEVYTALLPRIDDMGYATREMKIARHGARMAARGMMVDQTAIKARLVEHARRDDEIRRHLHDLGIECKTKISKAGKYRAAEIMGVDFPTGKDGSPLLNKETLAAVDHPLARDIMSLNGSRGLAGQILPFIEPDGRVHAQFDTSAQATGRWSVTDPGMTTFGKKKDLGDRDLFIPAPGHVLCSIDLAQIDVRGVAALSKDAAMISHLQPGEDWHMNVAEELFGERTPAARVKAKDMAHAINYNAQAPNISQAVGIPLERAQALLERMEESFPGLAVWKRSVVSHAQSRGWVSNGWGRRVAVEIGHEFTQGPGRSGQAWARDAIMECLLRCWERGVGEYIVMYIHDEFVFEFPEDRAEELRAIAVDAMAFEAHGVPVLCEASGFGGRWGDLYR